MVFSNVKVRRYIAISLLAAIIGITVAGSVLLIQHWEYMKMLEKQGLLGLFLISIFAGSPIPIPSPSLILTFTMGSIYNPALVGLVSGFGNTVGQVLVYLTGRGGLLFFQNLGFARRSDEEHPSWWGKLIRKFSAPKLREFARKHALLAVFILGMYPNPVLMPLIMGMGAARFSFWKFTIVCWAGKTGEALVLSYLGRFGLRSILRYFGIELP